MKDKTIGYGDNFNFKKRKMINYVYPQELNIIALDGNPANFYDYDFEKSNINLSHITMTTLKRYILVSRRFLQSRFINNINHINIYIKTYIQVFSFYAHEYAVNSLNKKNLITRFQKHQIF